MGINMRLYLVFNELIPDDDDSLITRTEFNCLKASVAVLEVNDHMNPQAIKFLGQCSPLTLFNVLM